MKAYVNLHNQFQDYLINNDIAIFNQITNSNKVAVDVRLDIYKNAYQSRLQQALEANYPILKLYLGDEQFEKLAITYINAHPSSYQSIRWFGDQLVPFLQETPAWQIFPYLAELAQFEWSCGLAFDAADSSILQIEEMATIPAEAWANIQFKAHSSVCYLDFSWNVVPIWQALTDDHIHIDPEQSSPITWLIWRKDLACQFSSLLEDEAWAIKAMISGATFGEICEGICQWHAEDAAGLRAASLLKSCILAEIITAVLF